jgi:hypothetical protein
MRKSSAHFNVRGVTVNIYSVNKIELTVCYPRAKVELQDEILPLIVNKTIKYIVDEGFLAQTEESISVKVTVILTDVEPKYE